MQTVEFDRVKVINNDTWPLDFEQPVLVLPFYGEFGHFIYSFIRQVQMINAPNKIVCCKPGDEYYFPSAHGFFYDWSDPFSDDQKCGYRNVWPPT